MLLYPIHINNADIDKVPTSNKIPFGKKGFKNFNGQKGNEKMTPLCKMPSKTSGYA